MILSKSRLRNNYSFLRMKAKTVIHGRSDEIEDGSSQTLTWNLFIYGFFVPFPQKIL